MDQVSTDDALLTGVGSRRSRMRSAARSRHRVTPTVPEHFQTPDWLDRSFVLPLTKPEQIDVPEPRHDHVPQQSRRRSSNPGRVGAVDGAPAVSAQSTPAGDLGATTPTFVRPPSDDIDFSAVIRRADLSRTALRTAWLSTGVSGLALIAFLLTALPVVAVLAGVCAAVAVSAAIVRIRLTHAPVPRVVR